MSMAMPNQEAIDTFINITGLSQPIALQKLQEHGGNLNEAVNAHFSEGDRGLSTSVHNTSAVAAALQDDFMDIDDELHADELRGPLPLLSSARTNPFSLLDPTLGRSIFDSHLDPTTQAPFVTLPREVREIPIEVKDGSQSAPQGSHDPSPTIEDVTGSVQANGPDIQGIIRLDDEDDDDTLTTRTAHQDEQHNILGDTSRDQSAMPSAPRFENLPDYSNDIEEEKRREEEARRKLQEEQELETQLAAKEASLPSEPSSTDENAVTLLVRMPDGSRRGRRFLRSDKLQSLFDFIDIARVVKPGSYRLVRPYPRRAFGNEESASILEELGLTNKQEALFLELV
uniref:UBX domain-containing protein n=1 Tax=Lotus japonicus TaxID=34305 RepID=I3SHZ7_LOTJA|nr:unknown [Lotus japonicus]